MVWVRPNRSAVDVFENCATYFIEDYERLSDEEQSIVKPSAIVIIRLKLLKLGGSYIRD